MSATVREINVVKTYDPTFEYEVSNDDTPAKLDVAYIENAANWVKTLPYLDTASGAAPGMSLTKIKSSRMEGNQVMVRLHYEGSDCPGRDPKAPPVYRYDVEIATAEEHLLTHPYYTTLTEVERRGLLSICNGCEVDQAGAPWENALQGALAQHALERIRKGFVAYLKPTVVYVQRASNIRELSALAFTLVGKIDTPPGPVTAEAGHWLYLGATATHAADGKTWSIEKRWRYSDTHWDTLYTPPS